MNFKSLKEIKLSAIAAGLFVGLIGSYFVALIFGFVLAVAVILNGASPEQLSSFSQTHLWTILIPTFFISSGLMFLGGYVTGRIAKRQLLLHGIVMALLACINPFYHPMIFGSKFPLWLVVLNILTLIVMGGVGSYFAKKQNSTRMKKIFPKRFLIITVLGLLMGGVPFHLAGLWIAYIPQLFPDAFLPTWKDLSPAGWCCLIVLLLVLGYWIYRIRHIWRVGFGKEKPSVRLRAGQGFSAGEIFFAWLAVGLVIAPFMWFASGWVIFKNLETAIVKAGYPTRYSYSAPTVPDNQNAVFWLQKALACPSLEEFNDKNPNSKEIMDLPIRFINGAFSGKFDSGDINQVQTLINKNSRALQLIRRAGQCPMSNWGTDVHSYQDFFGSKVPQRKGGQVLSLDRLLVCQALLLARKGQTEESLDLIRDGFCLARVYESTGALIDEMFAVAINKISLLGAPYVLEKSSAGLAKKKWIEFLKPDEIPQNVKNAMSIEFFSMPFRFFERKSVFFDETSGNTTWEFYYFPFLQLDLAAQLRYGKEVLDSLHGPYIQTAPMLDVAEKRFKRKSWWFSNISTGRFGQMYGKSLVNTAQFRLALLAVASREYKEKNGRWPESTKDLSNSTLDPSVFIDPFSGNPMILKKRATAF